jgi:hypothetical protein
MKFLCLDLDNCGYHHYLDDEEYSSTDFNKVFHICPNCDYLMILVESEFSFLETNTIVEKASSKLLKKVNKLIK